MVRRRRLTSSDPPATDRLFTAINAISHPLRKTGDLDPLIGRIGDARFVLLGEASHGTSEYYTWRDALSRRLIAEKGFNFIAVEGDWPDCYRVNRYVKGHSDAGGDAREALRAFERWPTWMWANQEVVGLAEWLRNFNDGRPEEKKVGFYGLDVYSLWDSLYQVMGYLGKHAPERLPAARQAFQCFEPYGEESQDYARATHWVGETCEGPVINMLGEVRRAAPKIDGDREAFFNAEQNAIVVRNAENYYRTMVRGGPESWNVRDRHMVETLERLMARHGRGAKAIVWEHNTHVGDARFTDMADDGMVNVGQLVREAHPEETFIVGFGSHRGSVIAGSEWGEPLERMEVPEGRHNSWEDVLHRVGESNRMLLFEREHDESLLEERGHRAIGVVYRPEYESLGNYVPTVLPRRYDAFLFIDESHALRPLHAEPPLDQAEVPETFPSGM